jgi:hypothetical protein
MKTYTVTIDVKAIYHVTVFALDEAEAREIGDAMQTTEVRRDGKLVDVESEVVDVNEEAST